MIFCVGRILQNFFSAGESMGGAIYLLENISEKRHDFFSSLYNASTIGGILLASGCVALLSTFESVEKGWRLLYVLGCMTAFFGCLIRKNMPFVEKKSLSLKSQLSNFWTYRRPLALITLTSGLAYANYSIALVLMNGFVPLVTGLTKAQMISLNTGLLVFDFCALPFFGWLSSKISREKLMIGTALAIALSSLPLLLFLKGATFLTVVAVRMCFVILGVAFFAPYHAWAQQLLPPEVRYSLISFGYALGSQLLGGQTAAISLWLFKETGWVGSVALYWMGLAFITTFVLTKTLQKKEKLA
jgi:MFS family permease